MKKDYTNPNTGISYTLQGDYYLPDLALPEEKETHYIGVFGDRHRRFLEKNRQSVYWELLVNSKLRSYLADIDEQAQERFKFLVKQFAEKEEVTEQLKAENQMEWVGKMNNIRNRVNEIINHEIIYA